MPRRHTYKPSQKPARRTASRTCSSKQTYSSRQAADRAISHASISRDIDNIELAAYLCSGCGKWHLTSASR